MISQRPDAAVKGKRERSPKDPETSRVAPTTARYLKGNPSGCVLMVAAD
jgi:hypothetical protein